MKRLACPRLVAYSLLMPSAVCAFILIAVAIIFGITAEAVCVCCIIWIFLISIMCIVYRNAFIILHIDRSGISSKHVHLDWENITDVSFSYVQIGVVPVYLKATVAVLNEEKKSFFKLDKRKTLYFEVNDSDTSELSDIVNMSDKDAAFSKICAVLHIR